MLNTMMKFSLLVAISMILTGCASSPFYHEYIMRGQVVGLENSEVIVCLGSEDGAKAGQILQVHRYVWEGSVEEGDDDYRVDYVGTLQIKSVVNDHFARAISTKGNVKKHDIVELKK